MSLRSSIRTAAFIIFYLMLFSSSTLPLGDKVAQVRVFTRNVEFDYISWSLQAFEVKINQIALGTDEYIDSQKQKNLVLNYLQLIDQIQQVEEQLYQAYSNPKSANLAESIQAIQKTLDDLYTHRNQYCPLIEAILQQQISIIVADEKLSFEGQPIPPVLYHSTPIPTALIVSPREAIRQDANISLKTNLTFAQQISLEDQVENSLNVSALVVDVGGIGVYPTMVMQTSDLYWIVEVIAHEWIHNYLTLRPLGMNYLSNSNLRTMNETTASIAGKELGKILITKYYPKFLPPSTPPEQFPFAESEKISEPPVFNFRAKMHETRITVDQLLAEGKIEQAEQYMEKQREMFWENGYLIRKLNQAYFAFHGAYADEAESAAGKDPVGAAVRTLWERSSSLAEFVNRMSWMWSFEQLENDIG